MSRPLVSVCTPFWGRHDLLRETILHLREQSYPNLEHCIAIDGRDAEAVTVIERTNAPTLSAQIMTDEQIAQIRAEHPEWFRRIPTRYVELGRNWTTYLDYSRHAAPMMVAQLLAAGEYLVWLADDERWLHQDAIAMMVETLERTGADFCYPKVRMWHVETGRDRPWIIGSDPPRHGQVTHVCYRAKLIERGLTRLNAGFAPDWDQIEQWIENGARWAFLPEIFLEHRADQ